VILANFKYLACVWDKEGFWLQIGPLNVATCRSRQRDLFLDGARRDPAWPRRHVGVRWTWETRATLEKQVDFWVAELAHAEDKLRSAPPPVDPMKATDTDLVRFLLDYEAWFSRKMALREEA
jgi:hypothetical protein